MTTCYECGENIIYSNDSFDVISKCSNEDCETHKEKERFDPFMSILHQEKRKLLDDLMNGVEDQTETPERAYCVNYATDEVRNEKERVKYEYNKKTP